MAKKKYLVGDRISKTWTIIMDMGYKGRNRLLKLRCDCGFERDWRAGWRKPVPCKGSHVRGAPGSRKGPVVHHGLSGTAVYRAWMSMRKRCRYPSNANYARYGGKGIKVCERWQAFLNFFADMGHKPANSHLHRLDSSRDYEPGNCVWMDRDEHNKLHARERARARRLKAQGLQLKAA